MINKPKLSSIKDIREKIEYELDFDFNASTTEINSIDEFNQHILKPYYDGKRIYYRGEKIDSRGRTLLPTIYRDKSYLLDNSQIARLIDSRTILDFYKGYPKYIELYEKIVGKVDCDSLYNFLAFSQDYFGVSPFIDLSKNPFVSLSFALKNRREYSEDILLYTVEIKNEKDYTTSLEVANTWLKDYSVVLFNDISTDKRSFDRNNYYDILESLKTKNISELTAPSAKLIDLPTNDLMRFQQGVFLLLDDFTVINKSYLTKKIQDDFIVKKWSINHRICLELLALQKQEAPYYDYENLMDLSAVVNNIKKEYMENK